MSKGLSSSGFDKKSTSEVLVDLKSTMSSTFGNEYSLENTKDAELLESISELYADIWSSLEDVYNSLIPSKASDVNLSNVVQYNGITRNAESPTKVLMRIEGAAGVTIPYGLRINNVDGNDPYIIRQEFTIQNFGYILIEAEAPTLGTTIPLANSLIVLETPYTSITSVYNSDDGYLGIQKENDTSLRLRRRKSVDLRACGTASSLESALRNLPNTKDVVVVENKTGVTDANGMTYHSMAVILDTDLTGTDLSIYQISTAEVIFRNRSMGARMSQNVGANAAKTHVDIQGISRGMSMHMATKVEIYVRVLVVEETGFPVDGYEQIKQAIVDWANGELIAGKKFGIGDDVIYSELYTPVYTVPYCRVTTLQISTSPNPLDEDDIAIAFDEVANFDPANMIVG